jgi:nucleotide-binding universal stress UspA family protein
MYERILVPLDGSKVGEAAMPYVEDLVSKLSPATKVEVTLFQVVSTQYHWVVAGEATARVPYTDKEMEQIKRKATSYLNKAGKGLKSKGAVVKCKVEVGKAAEEILKATGDINADLVAMSTHGRSGLGRWAFGSVTDKVLRAGVAPILIIRVPRELEKT